ncbi:hypothetical protein ACLB2K_028730 [Fragaria x ananassa]
MSGLNVKIDKFTGRNSFSLWQIKMRALLKQQGMWAPLVKKSGDPETAEMASLEEKAHSTILLCLADDIIIEVAEEETAAGLWLKIESLYMTKSLTNKLLLKRRLFNLANERRFWAEAVGTADNPADMFTNHPGELAIREYQLFRDLAARSASWGPGAMRTGLGVRGQRPRGPSNPVMLGYGFLLGSVYPVMLGYGFLLGLVYRV